MDRRHAVALPLAIGAVPLLGIAGSAGCGADLDAGDEPPVTIALGDVATENDAHVAAAWYLGRRLAALTGGRYEVDVRPDGLLGDEDGLNQQLRDGALPLARSDMTTLTVFDRRIGVLSMPYLFTSGDDVLDAMDAEAGASVAERLADVGIVVLGYLDSGPRNIYTTARSVSGPEDLLGLRLRVPEDVVAVDVFNALGAESVPTALNDIAAAIQTGVVDGADGSLIAYATSRYDQLAPVLSMTRHQVGVSAFLASRRWYDGLRSADRDALHQAATEAVAYERVLWKRRTTQYAQLVRERGVEIADAVDVEAFAAATRPLLDRHRSAFADLPGMLPVV